MKRRGEAVASKPPKLRLSVQYATDEPAPRRDRVRRWAAAALRTIELPDVDDVALAVRFVDEDAGRELNRDFRHKDRPTNVLTFAYADAASIAATRRIEADVVVCVPVVRDEAVAQGKSFDAHCAHLVVHGTLHACGFDHDDAAEADAMEAIERRVLARFRIDDPYRDEGTAAP